MPAQPITTSRPPPSDQPTAPRAGNIGNWEFFLWVSLGVAVAFGGAFLPDPEGGGTLAGALSWVPLVVDVIVMMLFGIRRWSTAKRSDDASSVESVGEDVYLLGYVFTLASLLGIGAAFLKQNSGKTPGALDTPAAAEGAGTAQDQLIGLAATKLTTTGLGLLMMLIYRNKTRIWAATRAARPSDEQRFEEALVRLNEQAKSLADNMGRVFAGLDPTHVWNIIESGGLVGDAMNKTAKEVKSLHDAMGKTAKEVESLQVAVGQNGLTGRLGELEATAGRLTQQLSAIPIEAGGATGALASLAERSRSLADNVERMFENLDQARVSEITRSGAQVVDAMNKMTTEVEGLRNATGQEGLTGQLVELKTAAAQLSQQLAAVPLGSLSSLAGVGTAFSRLERQLNDGLEPTVRKSTDGVDGFGQKAREGAEAMGDAVRKIQAAARALEKARAALPSAEARQAVESSRATVGETSPGSEVVITPAVESNGEAITPGQPERPPVGSGSMPSDPVSAALQRNIPEVENPEEAGSPLSNPPAMGNTPPTIARGIGEEEPAAGQGIFQQASVPGSGSDPRLGNTPALSRPEAGEPSSSNQPGTPLFTNAP